MTDYNNGQVHGWNGGECPVHTKSEITVWLRSGSRHDLPAHHCAVWDNNGCASDIIAFQVTKPYVEPKTIWVNFSGDIPAAYQTEDGARYCAAVLDSTRIAVKFIEVKE